MRFLSAGIYLLSSAGICICIVKISRTKSIKSLLPCLGLTAAIIVFPLAVNGIYLLAEASTVYSIMCYPLVLIYISGIMILDWMQYSVFAGKDVQVKVKINIASCLGGGQYSTLYVQTFIMLIHNTSQRTCSTGKHTAILHQ